MSRSLRNMQVPTMEISCQQTRRRHSPPLVVSFSDIRSLERDSGISDHGADDDDEEGEDEGDCQLFENKTGLSQDLRFLSGMPELCDVMFVVGEERQAFYGVKAILAIRSRVFYKMLYGPRASKPKNAVGEISHSNNSQHITAAKIFSRKLFSERTIPGELHHPQKRNLASLFHSQSSFRSANAKGPCTSGQKTIVHIEEFDSDVFKQLLEYVHTGSVILRPRTLLGLLNAADHFALEELRRACAEYSQKCINLHTVCSLLVTAERYIQYKSSKIFVQRVLDFVDKNGDDVLQLNDFVHLPRHVVELILSRDELIADEMNKFRAALRWSRHHLLYHPHETTLPKTVAPFLQYIAFHTLNVHVLMHDIRPLDVVPDRIMMNALAYQADPTSVRAGTLDSAEGRRKNRSDHLVIENATPKKMSSLKTRSFSVDRNLSHSSKNSSNGGDSGFHDDCNLYYLRRNGHMTNGSAASNDDELFEHETKTKMSSLNSARNGTTVVRIEPKDDEEKLDSESEKNNGNQTRAKSCYDLSDLSYFTSVQYKF